MKKHYEVIADTISLCVKYYTPKTFQHCLRVANYATKNVYLTEEEIQTAFLIGLCHDLLEDTQVSIEEIVEATELNEGFIKNVLGALTKNKEENYIAYIERLKSNNSLYPYIVKLADMKDHLMEKDTLTDKLKDKYWEALPYLL